ncbi:hypothetical protein [Roseospira navarrensis]|uniref:Uncharacterized protein n=1 Tax=Roseospira navarrensis TaxID=140058 RepID=A0A7X2D485_9PROT|nr:hypothetical protein [Roseospira navarrensis]MQX37596.1 hypothetical protein [Roseospira navarrensis]
MFSKISSMLGEATNLVRSVTNVTGSNAITDAIDDGLSTMKYNSDTASSNIEGTKGNLEGVGDAAGRLSDSTKE